MKRDDDQELWDLLGKASAPALSPFFARNVVRQVRNEGQPAERLLGWLRPRLLIPATAFALALTFAGITLKSSLNNAASDNPPDTVAVVDPQDYEVVADLDDLIASEDDNLWDDESLSL